MTLNAEKLSKSPEFYFYFLWSKSHSNFESSDVQVRLEKVDKSLAKGCKAGQRFLKTPDSEDRKRLVHLDYFIRWVIGRFGKWARFLTNNEKNLFSKKREKK